MISWEVGSLKEDDAFTAVDGSVRNRGHIPSPRHRPHTTGLHIEDMMHSRARVRMRAHPFIARWPANSGGPTPKPWS